MIAGVSTVIIGAAAATTAVVLTNKCHKDVSKTSTTITRPNPEPKITGNGGEDTSKHTGDISRNDVPRTPEALQLENELEKLLSGTEPVENKVSKDDVDKKLEELATTIGIDVSILHKLKPSERDGNVYIYASNIEDQDARLKVYEALKTGARYKYVISTEYQKFEMAMILYHTSTDNQITLNAIQELIDIIKAG